MPYDDGRNSGRARSARIRASHDYEATQLDSMRRRTREEAEPEPRGRLVARLATAFRSLRCLNPSPPNSPNPGPAHVPLPRTKSRR
jgi:hypothetical protein